MRPKDENQHGSMRPNLMSSSTRRAHSEDNILAMLERDSARRGSSSRMAWYGTCSALGLVLIGALAWLAYDNGSLHEDQVLTPVAVAPIPAVPAGSASTVVMAAPAASVAAAAPRPAEIQPARAATIVDAAPEPVRLADAGSPSAKPSASAPAPLVLLSPDEAASIQHAAAARAPEPEARPQREAPKAVAARAPARRAEPKREPPMLAPVHKRLVAKASAPRLRPAAHPPVRLAAHSGTPRLKKAQPAAPLVTEAPVDSDVALISAIISRSGRHAAEHPPAKP